MENTVLDMLGGLRSACAYTGAERLRELPRRATFIRCTQQLNPMYGPPWEMYKYLLMNVCSIIIGKKKGFWLLIFAVTMHYLFAGK